MNAEELQDRTFKFSLALIEFVKALPQYGAIGEITRQLLDAGTSVAANYRASCRARSRAEFNAKMGVVAEEADETVLWLQLLVQSKTAEGRRHRAYWKKRGNCGRSWRPLRRRPASTTVSINKFAGQSRN